jgi:predicted dehydrogenase
MIKICKENKSLLFINHQRRFDPLIQQWQKNIKNGLMGKIVQANCYYYNGLLNSGTHVIDLLIFFLGDAEWVRGFTNKQTSWKKNDENIDALIKFKNGTLATLQTLGKNYGLSDFHFYGEKGYFAIKNLGYETEYKKAIENKYCKGFYQLSEKTEKQGKPRSLMSSVVNHIVSCLDKKTKPVSQGEDGFKALKIIFALRESAKNQGKKINI